MVSYSEFLNTLNEGYAEASIKDSSEKVWKKLRENIQIPEFYQNLTDPIGYTLYQGSHFVERPHYERDEQILCTVQGSARLALVAHVHR